MSNKSIKVVSFCLLFKYFKIEDTLIIVLDIMHFNTMTQISLETYTEKNEFFLKKYLN